MRYDRWILAFSLLAGSVGCGNPAPRNTRALAALSAGGACTATFIDSSMVSIDGGTDVYVEGQALSKAGASYLIAGTPNYVNPPSAERRMVTPTRDSVFGAIRSPSGRWSLVPIPPPVRWFTGPRANAISEGRWEVVFVRLAERFTRAHAEAPLGVWYGIVSARGWERLEPIEALDGVRVEYMHSTPLMRSGDTLTWAFQLWRPNESHLPAAGVLQRIGGHWRFQLIDLETLAVSGYRTPSGEVRLVVEHATQQDPRAMQGTRYAISPALVPVDTVMPPSRRNRYYRKVDRSPDGLTSLTWSPESTDSVMWRNSILLGPDGEPPTARRFVAPYPTVNRVRSSPGESPWIFVADARDDHYVGHFEFLRVGPDSRVVVAKLPHRYIGPTVLAPRADTFLQYTGPVLVRDSSEARIASLLTSIDFDCRD